MRGDTLEKIEDLIHDGIEPAAITPPAPARKYKLKPSPAAIPRNATHRRFFKWITAGYDVADYEKIDGLFYDRSTNERAELALNAGGERWIYQRKLSGKDIASHRAKDITLRSAPIKREGFIRLRLDADAHQGQTDARQAVEWIEAQFLPGLYHEPSENGHAGYLDVHCPRLSARDINAVLDSLQTALASMLAAAGFKSSFEINGRLEIRGRTDNRRTISTRGRTAKFPRCSNDVEIERLLASPHRQWSDLISIINAATGIEPPPALPTPPVSTKVIPARSLDKRINALNKLESSGDKHRDRCRCVQRALNIVLGHRKAWPLTLNDSQAEQVIQTANTLYEQAGMATGARDAKRHAAFNSIARWMLTSPTTQAGDGIYFTDADLARAAEIIRSKIPSAKLEALNNSPACRKSFNSIKLTYAMLAMALCTYAKNSMISDGDCSAKAIKGMFDYYKIRETGATIATITKLLRSAGLIRFTRNGSYRPGNGGWCRSYAPTGPTWTLPFIAHLNPESGGAAVHSNSDSGRRLKQQLQDSLFTSMKSESSTPDESDLYGNCYFEGLVLNFHDELEQTASF